MKLINFLGSLFLFLCMMDFVSRKEDENILPLFSNKNSLRILKVADCNR